ncbi:MarR family winged helix-turn-helix transcriptional regulator [Geobacter grbiciae]|uniref:MarR family winged helix-turn-helix transcriptional regulator n=1 Tax=Geobacter grbiciae TaxID=155042 RepID=UPI001C0113BE|nr:MarR family transcriptional regulator [Geobacter grbiciae]MBT1075441.1 MarR family transcriptional regulator [Geobacter grbiciae]
MYDIENSIGFLLAKVYQRGFGLFKEQLDSYGLTPKQFSLLAFLWIEDNLSQTSLSHKTQVDRTTIGGLIDRLEKLGLVKRLPTPDDRRAYRICLTEKGRNLETELCAIAVQVTEKFLSPLTAEERTALRATLKKLRQ